MTDCFEELLSLYSNHSTAEIESGSTLLLRHFQVADANALLALEGYKEAFELVSSCSHTLDGMVTRHPDPVTQVKESIRLVRRMIDDAVAPKRIRAMRELVEKRLRAQWPAEQQAVYDRKKAILDWRDFFVSYTRRDAPATNQQFAALIRSCFGQGQRDNTQNHVARVLTRHLRRYQGLSGFFDEDNIAVGEDIQDKVDDFCQRAFALVQLIEPLALEREPPRNWCFHEYTQFTSNQGVAKVPESTKRHYFVLTGADLADVRPANLPMGFQGWVEHIDKVKFLSLQNERNSTLREKIKGVADQILAARREVISAWLDA